jgi:hypothetical protein
MKMIHMKTVLPLLGLLAIAGPASAHRGGPRGPGPDGPMLKEFDKNGDGKLDDAERATMESTLAQRHADMVKRFDANGDGTLDDAERAKMHDALAEERFKKLDTDGNGVLSLQEFKAGRLHGGPRGR